MEETRNLDARQFIVFRLGKEEYGIDTQKITSIVRMSPITRVPKTADYIKGVINLRGDIIPIMDLRTKFALPQIEETEDTRIIIVKIEEIVIGMIVDVVAEVLQLADDMMENFTNFSNDRSMDYILGVGKKDGRIVTLVNLEKLLKM